jgi:dsRNA-specific ribonuclease
LSSQETETSAASARHSAPSRCAVVISGEVKGIGSGKSKKEAEQEAAKKALEGLQIEKSEI